MEIKKYIHCNIETGDFTRIATCGRFPAGSKVGNIRKDGRLYIRCGKRGFMAHRLVWLFAYGEMPTQEIDHINGDPLDNRIANLRLATSSENKQNVKRARSNTKTGFLGVSWNKNVARYRADISLNNRRKFLGHFDTAEQAHAAYLQAKKSMHPFQTIVL